MIKKFHLIILSLLLLTFIIIMTGYTKKEATLNGYIVDKHCSEMKEPSEDTKMCLNMEACKVSGYGVSVKQAEGKYKFYKFDDKGQQLATDVLSKTTKEKGIAVEVKGIEDGDLIKVSLITEK